MCPHPKKGGYTFGKLFSLFGHKMSSKVFSLIFQKSLETPINKGFSLIFSFISPSPSVIPSGLKEVSGFISVYWDFDWLVGGDGYTFGGDYGV